MMIYKIFHFLFGYDYIYWHNTCDNNIARVHKNDDGTIWYFRYKTTKVIDIIRKPDGVLWLTCSSKKYFNEGNNG